MVYRLEQEASLGGKKNEKKSKTYLNLLSRGVQPHDRYLSSSHASLSRDLAVSKIQMFLFLITFGFTMNLL